MIDEKALEAAMRGFERLSPNRLRYLEKDKWHVCDIMAMREAITAYCLTASAPPLTATKPSPEFAGLGHLFDIELGNGVTPRIIDACYTAFMQAKAPNDEDGGPSDWFTDTRPRVTKIIAKMKKNAAESFTAIAARFVEVERELELRKNYTDADYVRLHKAHCLTADKLAAANARAERLEAALKPFADYATTDGFGLNHLGEELPDLGGVGWVYLTNGDFRRAREAYAGKPTAPAPDRAEDLESLAASDVTWSAKIAELNKALDCWAENWRVEHARGLKIEVGLAASEARSTALEKALEWYEAQVGSVRKNTTEGDFARRELDADCGARARAALGNASALTPKEVWLLVKDTGLPLGLEINGVFSSKEAALAVCDELSGVARFELGRNYTAEDRFFIATRANPEGVWAGKATAPAAPDRAEDLESLATSDVTWSAPQEADLVLLPKEPPAKTIEAVQRFMQEHHGDCTLVWARHCYMTIVAMAHEDSQQEAT